VTTTRSGQRRGAALRLLRRRRSDLPSSRSVDAIVPAGPTVDLRPGDPALAFFQSVDGPIDLDSVKLDTPGVQELRAAGVKLVVPLVTNGELIGLLNLGPRLSEQDYSADDRQLLESLAAQAAPALRVAQLVREQEAEVRRRERYQQEMRVAQLIQQNFLPKELPRLDGWGIDAFYRPAREVGGDFYDVIDLPGEQLGIVVGDVTDKGVPAALVMASTRSVLRASAQRLVDPSAVLQRVNDQIVGDMPPAMFVTCLYGILDPSAGRFRFANAGHNLPCVQTDEGPIEARATGMPLGLLPGMRYPETDVEIPPGRSLLLYSDALPEAHAPDGRMFGFPRVVEQVGAGPSGAALIDHLLADLRSFTSSSWDQEDDITLVVVHRDHADGPVGVRPAPRSGARHAPVELVAFSVPSVAGNERLVLEHLEPVLAGLGLDEQQHRGLCTAAAEAAMNAIEHGNDEVADRPVDVQVFASDDAVSVRIRDAGRAPVDLPADAPDLEAKLRGEQSPRGWGLFLMTNLVDEVEIDQDEGHHTVTLVVRRAGGDR
jgi:serine phosphatase RsbU (regulator of sigma subunit)/anti-sigma regulatory factor (Ser/Thr protein kinase)